MAPNIFEFEDYVRYLNSYIKHENSRGLKSLIAAQAGCQKSYLSKVLAGKVHLTPEQSVGVTKALKLSAGECEYFIELVYFGRAGNSSLAQFHLRKMHELKSSAHEVGSKLNLKTDLSKEQIYEYFSDADLQIVHMSLLLEECQDQSSISSVSHISEVRVRELLLQLQSFGLLKHPRLVGKPQANTYTSLEAHR